jgi:hypothetical protein
MASFLRKRFGSDKLIETVAGVVNSALVLRFGASLFDLVYPIGIAMHLERHSVQPGRRPDGQYGDTFGMQNGKQ